MSRTRKRFAAVIAAAALAALTGSGLLAVGTAPPVQAAGARDGVCASGEFCYYYNSDHAGSVSDFDVSVADYGTTQPSCFDFKGPGNGQGECVKNEAASVWNRSGRTVRVYYNSNYGGTYQAVAAGAKVNLGPALYNNNASHKFGPFVAAPSSRPSYYVSTQSTTWARNVGCSIGTSDRNQGGRQVHTIVLAFGKTTKGGDGVHRLSYFGGADRTFADARRMVVAMGKGYDGCTGADTTSVLRIGLGTSNYPGSAVTGAAGRALARAAKGAASDLADYSQATAWGAVDFEAWGAGSGLNGQSRNMLDGYNGVTGRRPLVNFGSADGCPTSSVPSAGSCNAGLSADTIWYVSTRGAARPLPEIYTTTGSQAKQWKNLSLYAHRKGAAMSFPAVMAQRGACDQRGGCTGTDNSPATAWTQLNEQLDGDSRTATNPGAPTNIHWQETTTALDSGSERTTAYTETVWPSGIFADAEAPARGAEFRGGNRWVGQVADRTLIVWAGRSGTDASLGRLLIASAGTDGMLRSHDVVDVPGAGTLRVASAHAGVLVLVDEHGARHRFDAGSGTFR
ncbi:peptidase inhibitor family I36 protein [Promicromonospora aerolata]|uniref:Peptidase inhibitor family I36 protein n=1 Tax=Promicromonospora aerolata TaxID=195749 RepID=A0ABW4V369_9MICO